MSSRIYTHRYGCTLDRQLNDLELEMLCFRTSRTMEQGGVGKFGHLRNAASIILPKTDWNPWLEWSVQSLCDDHYARKEGNVIQRTMAWTGNAASGKTHSAAFYGFLWFLADPMNSILVLTSTSAKMVRRRIWPIISSIHLQVRDQFGDCGHIIDSKTCILAERGNDKNAIFAMAIGEGETNKAAANIQGMHAKRIMIVLDEATDVEEAILVAKENLKKACDDYTELYIGNAKSRLDPLGRAMTPKKGWNSISVEHEEWETEQGYCLHFDGFKSPNVAAKKTIYPYLYSYENYLIDISKDTNTLEFWMYTRGFPPPDTVSNTILSEPLIERCKARDKHTFISKRKNIAALDPGFGGDDCVLQFAVEGDIETDLGEFRTGIELSERIKIEFDVTNKTPKDLQIAARVIDECRKRNVAPRDFGCDATGTGRGVFAIIYQDWSAEIRKVEFGGAPSDLPSSEEDPRPASECYDRRVTELWYTIKAFVCSGQLCGLDDEVIRELCSREFTYKARKISLETKEDFKARLRHSPDRADALAVLCAVSRSNGNSPVGKSAKRDNASWISTAKRFDTVNTDEPTPEQEELFPWIQN
jgi:hypothetical protein